MIISLRGRPPDESHADFSPPVLDFYRWLRSWIRRLRVAIAPARHAIFDLQITQYRAAHFDLWARPPRILRLLSGLLARRFIKRPRRLEQWPLAGNADPGGSARQNL
jgi:hypothetical protein